jgi:ectoine hydroxylase-related dioxygenase (phytanoyl-CoA dioxygenase family)
VQLTSRQKRRFCDDGFVLVYDVLDAAAVEKLRRVVDEIAGAHQHNGRAYAARNMLRIPEIAELARSEIVVTLVKQAIRREDAVAKVDSDDERHCVEGSAPQAQPAAVRGLLFNNVAEANWAVPWHQDLTIAVRERREAPGFGPWSVKDSVVHVQPPDEVIARMLAVRIHLDDTDAENGALRVIPGSHREGRLSPEAIGRWTTSREAVTIEALAGSVLLMRPHLLHASSAAKSPGQRRVIHLEYAAGELPHGLQWNEEIK